MLQHVPSLRSWQGSRQHVNRGRYSNLRSSCWCPLFSKIELVHANPDLLYILSNTGVYWIKSARKRKPHIDNKEVSSAGKASGRSSLSTTYIYTGGRSKESRIVSPNHASWQHLPEPPRPASYHQIAPWARALHQCCDLRFPRPTFASSATLEQRRRVWFDGRIVTPKTGV